MRYYPVHLHLHTSMETGGSLAGHIYNAQSLGMRYIWFTDHDYRLNIRKNAVKSFDFSTPHPNRPDGDYPLGWRVTPERDMKFLPNGEHYLMQLSSKGTGNQWTRTQAEFISGKSFTKSRHVCSLMHGVTVHLVLNAETGNTENVRVIVCVTLSKRPPDGEYARMLYVWGDPTGLEAPHTQILPLEKPNGDCHLRISEDVSNAAEIGGMDNAFGGINVITETRNGAAITLNIGGMSITHERCGDEVRALQREFAEKLYRETGVRAFIASEFSEIGMHKNCFNTNIPLMPEQLQSHTEDEGAAYLKAHGAVFAYNHPLTGGAMRRERFFELLSTGAYGATLIEVGYPEGRGGSLADYLGFWDDLTASGLFLTAYGSSDSHDMMKNWFSGNNFCAYLGVADEVPEEVPEKAFLTAMQKGNVYTGDPTKLHGTLSFETFSGIPQGCVLQCAMGDTVGIRFTLTQACPGWTFRCIQNGTCTEEQTLSGGEFVYRTELTASRPISFCRCELYDETGRLIALTNPIHLARASVSYLPSARIIL